MVGVRQGLRDPAGGDPEPPLSQPGNLAARAFGGTAQAYLRYRQPYPKALLDELLQRASADGQGVLVDLACGPGRVALAIAGAFERVIAIDLEPEMIAVGREEAARRGIANIDWRVGRAEDADIAAGSIDLVTIGEAFHRLDQGVVARRALSWLKGGGLIAILGTESLPTGADPWLETARSLSRRWADRAFPQGWAERAAGAEADPERALARAGFAAIESRAFEEPRTRSFEEVLGYFRSTSICSEQALGPDFPAFAAELRAALAGDRFEERFRSGYTLGRKPL
ncbi:MAG TPA: class I SAM-dependent methyltransferase [Caulobacteraceae bacterium]|nr:class I SAM-dependent methyltransferase [Caulobacteraceae bacterium]